MTKLLIKFLCLALISVSYTANAGSLFMKSIGVIFDDTEGAERVAAGTITEQLIGALFEDPNFESKLLDSTGTYSLHYISN